MSAWELEATEGGLFAVAGLEGAACKTGVKPSGAPDLALIVADEPLPTAGMFTTCAAAAAPVQLCREVLAKTPHVRSIVVNSGNANALTGERGLRDAQAMMVRTAKTVGGPTLVLSTGIIGVPLPIDKVLAGIQEASETLHTDADLAVSTAFLTTDTRAKQTAVRVTVEGKTYTVGGVAKGSGMIHPKMATMLAVMATDAPMDPGPLRELLAAAVDRSFHEISVDGDTSTNDAVLLMARPAAGSPLTGVALEALGAAVTEVARSLAGQILEDGEGMTRIMDIEIRQAATEGEARAIARSIATSSLVKTALAGGDPNWGRVLAAAGNAGVPFEPSRAVLKLAGIEVFRNGEPLAVDAARLNTAFARDRVEVILELGRGKARGRMRTTDLTHRYVEINAEYTT